MFLFKKGWKEIHSNFPKAFRKQEAVVLASVLVISVICSAFIVNANYQNRKEYLTKDVMSETQILGTENHIVTNTLVKKEPAAAPASGVQRTVDIITPVRSAYTMEDRELLAQMMFAEEGVFFSRFAGDTASIERVHKLAGSVVLHRLNSHFSGAQTLADVLYAPGQYDYRTIQRVEKGQPLPDLVYQWADELLSEGALGPDTLVFQAEFPQGKEVYDHIGNQYFCCR